MTPNITDESALVIQRQLMRNYQGLAELAGLTEELYKPSRTCPEPSQTNLQIACTNTAIDKFMVVANLETKNVNT